MVAHHRKNELNLEGIQEIQGSDQQRNHRGFKSGVTHAKKTSARFYQRSTKDDLEERVGHDCTYRQETGVPGHRHCAIADQGQKIKTGPNEAEGD